jgi:hypothetical protein
MKPLALLFSMIFLVIVLLWGPSCANIIPPAGGPRDSLPPVLISATPGDSTLNFNSDRIVFEFDEYVDLQDVAANVLFTPTFERNPELAVKGRTITVRFREPLETNTTYTLSFGNAIRDINESNVLRGFTYSFATGPVMDSLELAGRVVLAQNGRIDSTLIVVLHRDLTDSAVFAKRPPYVSRVDANGNFRFRNLPDTRFAVYAIGNAGISRRYQRSDQLFAFTDSAVRAGTNDTILLYAYSEKVAQPSAPAVNLRSGSGTSRDRLTFTTNLSNNRQDLLKPLELTFQTPLKVFDPSKINLTTDSTFNPVEHSFVLDTSSRIIRAQTQWLEGRSYNLVLDREFAEDSLGKKLLKSDTLFLTANKTADYGSLTIKVRDVSADENPVLLFIQNDQVIQSAPLVNGSFLQPLFLPGEYEIRILFDRNNNGTWDPGKFFGERRQPEIIRPIERKITVKPNWQNDFELGL